MTRAAPAPVDPRVGDPLLEIVLIPAELLAEITRRLLEKEAEEPTGP